MTSEFLLPRVSWVKVNEFGNFQGVALKKEFLQAMMMVMDTLSKEIRSECFQDKNQGPAIPIEAAKVF